MPGWPLIRPGIVLVLRAGTGRHHLNSPATEAALFSSSDVCRHVKPQRGSSPNAPHQYLDNHGNPSRALCYYSVPDARKRDFAYLCQRSFRPGASTLNPGGLIFSKRPEEATKIIRAPASCSDHRRCEGLPSALYQIEQRGRLSSRERFWSLQQVVFGLCPSCLLCCAAGVKRGAATIDLPDSRGALTPSTYRVSCD